MGCSAAPDGDRPSMVVIDAPSAITARTVQDFTACPLISMMTTWRFSSMSAICFSHPRASREADVGDINCNGNEVRMRGAVRISSIGAPPGRDLDSVEIPEGNLEPSPLFAMLIPRFDLFRLYSGQQKEKRRIEVIPDRVAAEIGEIQIVPFGFHAMAIECGARVASVPVEFSLRRFNGGIVGPIDAAHAGVREGLIADHLAPNVSRDVD